MFNNLVRFSKVTLQFFIFLLRPLFILCHSIFLEGEPPPPRSTPLGVYRSAISYGATQHSYTHSLMADRSMAVGHVPMVHTCFYVHQSHRHDSTYPGIYMSLGAFWEPSVCSYDISHSRTKQVSITS